MTAASTAPDMWKEVCLIGIIQSDNSGTEVAYAGLTEDITGIDIGDKDITGIPLLNGGRVVNFTPQGDCSVTMKVVPVTAKVDSSGIVQGFYPQSTLDSVQPILVDATRTRNTHRLIFLWAGTLPATAGAHVSDTCSMRLQVVNAYMTGYKPSFDDKRLTAEITFKWAPFNKSAVANERWESDDGSGALAAAGTSTTVL